MNKSVMIGGVTGQLGSILASKFINMGYKVYGLIRRSSVFNTERIEHLYQDPHDENRKLELIYADLSDYASIVNAIVDKKPDIFCHCWAQSHVRVSFDIPEFTMDITGTGTIRCLEAIRKHSPHTRFINCASSEMFGTAPAPQSELSQFKPQSVYAIAKCASFYSVVNYRDAYKLFASNAIMFNYTGEQRGKTFFERKLTMSCARIKLGLQDYVYFGDLTPKRGFLHYNETSDAFIQIALADEPDDYVIASGDTHSMQELVEIAFKHVGLDWEKHVRFDERYLRPTEVPELRGDYSKIKNKLGWEPKMKIDEIIKNMVDNDLVLAQKEILIKKL